jgi:hypothetical protein
MLLLRNKKITFVSLFVLVGLFINSVAFSQRIIDPDMNPSLKERMYFGGNFSLQLGTITFIEVSPLSGVMLTEKLSTGLGATYQYFNDRRFAGGNNHIYGGRTFVRYNIFPKVFAYSELEALNLDVYNVRNENFNREWVPGFFVGGGYFSPAGNRGGVNFTLLYNLMHDNRRSPYNEPFVVRVGFLF